MPTYGYLYGQHVAVNMTEANFESVEAGVRHVMKLTVRNTSLRGQRVRLVAPRQSEFTLHVQNDVDLAPGLQMEAELAYYSEEPQDVEGKLVVQVGRADARADRPGEGEQITIPVRAMLPGAKLVFDQTVDFGTTLPGQSKTLMLTVANTGSREGRLNFGAPPSGSKFAILPLEALVGPGDTASFKCDIKCDQELGPQLVKLPININGSMGFFPKHTELILKATVADPTIELRDAEGKPLSASNLGRLYCGLETAVRATLVNGGPTSVNYSIAKATEDSGGAAVADDGGDEYQPLTVDPPMGRVPAGGSLDVMLRFRPKQRPLPAKGFVSGDEPEETTEDLSTSLAFEVLETGQKVPLRLEGTALAPRVAFNQGAFNFDACAMYEHREVVLKMNNTQDLPYQYALVPPAHFGVTPTFGTIPPHGTAEVTVSFKPHQVGDLAGVMKLLGFGGRVATHPIQLYGKCTAPAHRMPAGGTMLLPEEFPSAEPPNLVDQTTVSFPPAPIGAKWHRPPQWEMSETLQGGKVQQGGSAPLEKLTALTKKKTYQEQLACQPVLDAIDQMDTGLELPAAAIRANVEHRAYYNTFLKSEWQKREERRKRKHVVAADPETFLFGTDLGLDPFSGCTALVPPVSNEVQPLFLHHPYDETYDPKAGLSSALFDPFRTGGKKYKAKPETADEIAECRATLTPEELGLVTGGPKTIEFGTVSVFTQVTRCFTVINELRASILVALDLSEEPELKQPPPQVIPPGGSAGFDVTFSSSQPQRFRRTITWTVNGAHGFKFVASAVVEPIELGMSEEEVTFRFPDGSLDPTLSQTIVLSNPGTYPAVFRWESPESHNPKHPPPFMPSVMSGEVPPKKTLPVEITFAPYLGQPSQHVLTAVVEGGSAKNLHCKADVQEARAVMSTKRLDFGTIPAGIAKERTFLIKNPGPAEAVFSFDDPPESAAGGFIIKPMRGAVRAGGSMEVSVEVMGVPPGGAPGASVELTATLSCTIRMGKPLKLPVRAECRVPEVTVEEDEIGFGGVVAGATNWQPLTLRNASVVPATLHLDLTSHPDVLVGLMATDEAAEAAAAADDRATTVIPDEDAEESPLQLISFPSQSPPATSAGLGEGAETDAGAQQQAEMIGGRHVPKVEEKRIYSVLVPPEASLSLKLGYAPREAADLMLELPLCGVGLPPAPALRRVVHGEGLKPRLQLSPVITQMGSCILRAAVFPYETTASVTNMDTEPLAWQIDTSKMPSDCGFTLSPSSGKLRPNESTTIKIAFAAVQTGPVDVAVPLYIDGNNKTPYLTPHFLANAVPPRLTFDRPELVLPSVPLGHTAKASFYVINEGYDNLQIQAKLPIDSQRIPLTLEFPEGSLVGVSKERILATVSFTAKKPTAFTAFIELLDTEGTRFALPVTATTDNSIVTTQPYLTSLQKADPKAAAIITKDGKAPTLVPPPPPPPPPDNLSAKELRTVQIKLAQQCFLPPTRDDATNAQVATTTSRAASVLLAYVSSAVLALPAPLPAGGAGNAGGAGTFPSQLTTNNGAVVLDLIQLVSGKSVPLPDPPADRKNPKLALRHEVMCYDAMLAFLRAHGGMLAHVKPEMLLPLDPYLKLIAGNGPPLGRKERSAARRDHQVRHPEAWLEVLFQAVKTFVLGRVTSRAFKALPGMGDGAAAITREVASPNYASALYGTSELLLLKWLAHHSAAAPETALGVGDPLAHELLYGFDKQLRDGHVFARVLLNHCPFLALVDPQAPPTTPAGEPEFGTSIDNLYPRPCSPAQSAANLGLVLGAMQTIGLRFSAAAGMPELVPSELFEASSREMLLFVLYLYQQLPHYVPKATVSYVGGLHEHLTKTLELSNPAKKPIVYEVRLEGAPCFRVADSTVRLEGKQTLGFKIDCLAVFTGQHTGRVLFLSRGDGISTAHASTLVFDLAATIDIGAPLETASAESKLYQPQTVAVAVTNPFDTAATFRLSFTETKPPLDLPKIAGSDGAGGGGGGGGGGKGGGGAGGLRQGFAAASAVTRAAKMAGLSMSAMGAVGGQDDPARKLPSSFWSAQGTLVMEPRATVTLNVQFLPFQLGEYSATILFADETVGEFSYGLTGSSSLPPPLETLTFASESSSSAAKDIQLPFRNPQLERARALVLERSAREKEKWGQLWGKEPLQKGPVPLQLSYGSAIFSGPASLDLVDNERRGRGGGQSGTRTAAGSTLGSLAGSGAATPRTGGRESNGPPPTGNADANKLQLRFVPNEPGQYTSEVLLLSPLDVRLYDLAGSCSAPPQSAALEFVTPARMPLRQELPVVNNSDADWSVSANLRGEGFSGPPSIKVAAHTTGHYPLDFAPDWIGDKEGELVLSNLNTGDKYNFQLKGIGEEPLAEGNISVSCEARVPTPVSFHVSNILGTGEACELRVDSDLLHVSGPGSVAVPARGRGVPAAAPNLPTAEYVLTASPQLGGAIHGSVTFTAPDGRYCWYTVELRAEPPPAEKKLEISAPLRKVVAVEIPISNPASSELDFTVIIQGDGLLGDESIRVEGGGDASYELLFSPLVAGTTSGQVAFVNPQAGEFWYELELTGEPTEPVDLPTLRCAVGASVTHEITVSNPIGEELPLQLNITNNRNFKLDGPKATGGSLVLPPYGELSATVTFTPSALDEVQTSMISLTHPKLGEWVYSAKGVGHAPADMPVTSPSAPLGHTTSGTIGFRNPFDQPLSLDLVLEQPSEVDLAPPFELLARRKKDIVVAPGTTVQFPFSFVARDMGEAHAAVVLHGAYKGRHLTWRFPIVGEAISRPLTKPIHLHVAARQPLTQELNLPLPGLVDSARDEPFTYELDLDAQNAALIEGSLTLTPLQRTLAGGTLVMAVDWRPLRPVRTSAALIVRKQSGGRWRYDLVLEAGEPQPDDVIYIESPIHKTAQVQFKLCNAFDEDAPFQAYFSADSASVFTVSPGSGILTRAGTAGTLFTVSYTPVEYGKPVRGTLVVLTDEMQWSYEVRGMHPQYTAPQPMSTKVDHVLDPAMSMRLGQRPRTNFLKKNMDSTGAGPSSPQR